MLSLRHELSVGVLGDGIIAMHLQATMKILVRCANLIKTSVNFGRQTIKYGVELSMFVKNDLPIYLFLEATMLLVSRHLHNAMAHFEGNFSTLSRWKGWMSMRRCSFLHCSKEAFLSTSRRSNYWLSQ
jgi:hypothetical protein